MTSRDDIERVLRENGLSDQPAEFDSNIHSWRCEYPDRYGPCTCFSELVDDLMNAITTPTDTTPADCTNSADCGWSCPTHQMCGRCNQPATGFATIDNVRYCHGDNDNDPTCYQQTQHDTSRTSGDMFWIDNATEPRHGRAVGPTVLKNVHDPSACEGQFCVMHNPSDHHMRDWPTNWRGDRRLMERICPHGIGHPDPDDNAYQERIGNTGADGHGCDGCCKPT